MIPAKFDYSRAESAAEAISQLTEYGDEAKLLSGIMGHNLCIDIFGGPVS